MSLGQKARDIDKQDIQNIRDIIVYAYIQMKINNFIVKKQTSKAI